MVRKNCAGTMSSFSLTSSPTRCMGAPQPAFGQRVSAGSWRCITDDWGSLIQHWTPYATAWAAVEPLTGRKYFAADAAQSEVSARIRLRYRTDLQPTDEVEHLGQRYRITAIIQVKSNRRETQLMVKS